MLACSRCWRDAGGALRLRVSAHWRRNPRATHNGRTHDGPIPLPATPCSPPSATACASSPSRCRTWRRASVSVFVRTGSAPREPPRERHQPLRGAHGVQGHGRAQLPADQPRRRAAGRRGQRPHRQGPHRLPHARPGARRGALRAHARRHRAARAPSPTPSWSASARCCCRSTSRTRTTRCRPPSSCSTAPATARTRWRSR